MQRGVYILTLYSYATFSLARPLDKFEFYLRKKSSDGFSKRMYDVNSDVTSASFKTPGGYVSGVYV